MPEIVLIPVLTGRESEKRFLLEAAGGAGLAVVVYLIDQSSGLTASEMSQELEEKEKKLEEIEGVLHSLGKRVKVYNEWGSWEEKLPVIAKREDVGEIAVKKAGKKGEREVAIIKSLGIPVREIG